MQTIHCDRCGQEKEGFISHTVSGGCYTRNGWAMYMDGDEYVVCDDCMWADHRYTKDYGSAHEPLHEKRNY